MMSLSYKTRIPILQISSCSYAAQGQETQCFEFANKLNPFKQKTTTSKVSYATHWPRHLSGGVRPFFCRRPTNLLVHLPKEMSLSEDDLNEQSVQGGEELV